MIRNLFRAKLNPNVPASSCDDSIESVHADSRCHVVIKAPSYFQFENVNVMRNKNDKFNITIHYPYEQSHCKN